MFDPELHDHDVMTFAEELQKLLIPLLKDHTVQAVVDGLLLTASAMSVASGQKISGRDDIEGGQKAQELQRLLSRTLRRFIREECGLTERN